MDTKNSAIEFEVLGGLIGFILSFILSYEQIQIFLKNNATVSLHISSNIAFFLIFIMSILVSSSLVGKMIGSWLYNKLHADKTPDITETSQNKSDPATPAEASDANSCAKVKALRENASAETTPEQSPVAVTEAAAPPALTEIKKEFEEKISTGTFEDPNVVVEHPGEMLVETPATLFSKEPVKEPEKPELPEESFPRKELAHGPPTP